MDKDGTAEAAPLTQLYLEEVSAYEAFLQRIYKKRTPPARGIARRRRGQAEAPKSSADEEACPAAASSSAPAAVGEPEEDAAGHHGTQQEVTGEELMFRYEVELEEEILARAQRGAWERNGTIGAAVLLHWKGTEEAFFVDAFNATLLPLLRRASEETPTSPLGEGLEAALHIFGNIVGGRLMHCSFPREACGLFQAFFDLLVRPNDGVDAIFSQWLQLDRSARQEHLRQFQVRLYTVLQELVLLLKSLVESLEGPEDEVAILFHALVPAAMAVALPVERLLPDVAEEEQHRLLLRVPEPLPHLPVAVSRVALASELKELLVQRLCFPETVRLLREEDGDYVEVGQDQVLADCSGTLCVDSVGSLEHLGFVHTRVQDPFIKLTTRAATRLLAELRSTYAEPAFFRDYHQLRLEGQGLHVDKAIGVQSLVLPHYGFEGSRRGVMEMRNQVSFLADKDAALNKALKDIHLLLDAHQPLPSMPITKGREAPRFLPEDVVGWTGHLADEGFVVIAGVADAGQVSRAYSLLWDFLESADTAGRVCRSNINSWHDSDQRGVGWPAGDDGIIGGRGVGQSQAMWFLRGLPKLRRVFAELWGTDRLVASFDGAGVFRPYGHDRNWKTRKKNWFHIDQAHYKRGLHCVQGLITLKDATEETGGLVVVPGSHRFHNDVLRRYDGVDAMEDFVRIDITDPVLVEGETGPMMVPAQAGDLVLWDSRTVHCNTAPLRENRALLAGDDLIRAVAYICMTPAAWCSSSALQQRRQGVEAGATTKHWPHEYHPKSIPRTWNPGFQLSSEQWSLVDPSAQLGHETCRPGSASCRPPGRYKVATASSELRNAATTKWAKPLWSLRGGEVVDGYPMGPWLLLSRWPQELGRPKQCPDFGADEDVWAVLSDFEPC